MRCHEATKVAGKTATNVEAEPDKCEVKTEGKGREEVQGKDVRHGERGGGGEGGEEGRKLGEDHPKMKGQDANKAIGRSTNDLEIEPAKYGRSKRPRQALYPMFKTRLKPTSKVEEGGDGSGGAKVGAMDEVVTGAKEETSQGDSEEPRDEKGLIGGFRVNVWDPGSRPAGRQ